MFEAQLEKVEILKKVIDSIKEIVNEVNFDCKSTGLYVQAMDTSHVALIAMELRNEYFTEYRCDRAVSLGINVEALSKFLKCAGSTDKVILQTTDARDNLVMSFESANRVSEFNLVLMDLDTERVKIPKMEYECVVTMGSKTFQNICREINTIGDIVTISVSKQGVTFGVEGEMGNGSILLQQENSADDDSDGVAITMSNDVEMKFALRFLNHFTKATPLAKTVTLSMSPQVPLVVEYAMEDAGHVRFYLAPKIEDEDDDDDDDGEDGNQSE